MQFGSARYTFEKRAGRTASGGWGCRWLSRYKCRSEADRIKASDVIAVHKVESRLRHEICRSSL